MAHIVLRNLCQAYEFTSKVDLQHRSKHYLDEYKVITQILKLMDPPYQPHIH